ncbi:MAG: hypothetical protein MRY75_18575, partial [Marivita sp.]|uniref:hypothetical protein n=1 Tax=Marivita sp. TaxID=2003365 RepID=UPI0025C56911
MTYSSGTPLKAVAGRLALDFVNTADWTPFGSVQKDRIERLDDLSRIIHEAANFCSGGQFRGVWFCLAHATSASGF